MERSAEQVISPNNSVRLLAHKAEGRVWGKVSNGDGGSSWDNHNNNNNKCFLVSAVVCPLLLLVVGVVALQPFVALLSSKKVDELLGPGAG